MIPKEVIEKAIEGGYQHDPLEDIKVVLPRSWVGHFEEYLLGSAIALDTTFWEALGKALGWEPHKEDGFCRANCWEHYALVFYRLVLRGGTKQFWADLLANK